MKKKRKKERRKEKLREISEDMQIDSPPKQPKIDGFCSKVKIAQSQPSPNKVKWWLKSNSSSHRGLQPRTGHTRKRNPLGTKSLDQMNQTRGAKTMDIRTYFLTKTSPGPTVVDLEQNSKNESDDPETLALMDCNCDDGSIL